MDMKEVIHRRQTIEKAFARGVLTQDEFVKKCLENCAICGCDQTTKDICAKDGPCCDVKD